MLDAVVSLLEGAAFASYIDSVASGQTWADGQSRANNRALVRPIAANLPQDARLRFDDYAQVQYDLEIVWTYSNRGDLTAGAVGMQDALAEAFGDGGETLRAELGSSDLASGALRVELGAPFAENQPDPLYNSPEMPENVTMRWTLTVRAWATL